MKEYMNGGERWFRNGEGKMELENFRLVTSVLIIDLGKK